MSVSELFRRAGRTPADGKPRSGFLLVLGLCALGGVALATCGRNAPPEAGSKLNSSSRAFPEASATTTESVRAPSAPPASAPLKYLELPLGGAAPNDKLPLVIAIHGLGDQPQNFSRWLVGLPARVRLIVPQAPTAHGQGYSWFPYRPERSEHELAQGIAQARDQLIALLDVLEAKHPGLPTPAVLGFSQGGMLSFALAARYPERFSLVIPLSGTLPQELDPPSMIARSLPTVHAFHGEADAVVPIAPAADAVSRLTRYGYSASLQRFPNVGHQIPAGIRDAVFADLSAWVAQQHD